MTKLKISLIAAIAIAGVTASLRIRHQALLKLRENELVFQQQNKHLAELAAEHQRLSNLVVLATDSTTDDRTSELVQLRKESAALRNQINELGKQREGDRPSSAAQTVSARLAAVAHARARNRTYIDPLDPRADGKVNDAMTLAQALGEYASRHQAKFPSDLAQVAPYLNKLGKALTGTNEFELTYQGSRNELANVPPASVAVIRERQAWLTAEGKWSRVYAFADGSAEIVEPTDPEDNFQSWEAGYIIPPPVAVP